MSVDNILVNCVMMLTLQKENILVVEFRELLGESHMIR